MSPWRSPENAPPGPPPGLCVRLLLLQVLRSCQGVRLDVGEVLVNICVFLVFKLILLEWLFKEKKNKTE